jgi:hypothetical protein
VLLEFFSRGVEATSFPRPGGGGTRNFAYRLIKLLRMFLMMALEYSG